MPTPSESTTTAARPGMRLMVRNACRIMSRILSFLEALAGPFNAAVIRRQLALERPVVQHRSHYGTALTIVPAAVFRPLALERESAVLVFADEQNALTHGVHDAFDFGVLLFQLECDLVAGHQHDPCAGHIGQAA